MIIFKLYILYLFQAIVNLNGCFDPIKIPVDIKIGHITVQEPRPIGFSKPPEQDTEPSIVPYSKNNMAQAAVGK